MSLLTVDVNKCTKCGSCIESCPLQIIGKNNTGIPELNPDKERVCIACGHCIAVCPTRALDNQKNPLKNQLDLKNFPVISSELAEKFLRSRRSIRNFKPDKITHEKLLELLNIARFSPSGGNSQGISYLVVSEKNKLLKMSELVVEWMEKEIEKNSSWIKVYTRILSIYRKTGYDIILRNAPHVIIALTPSNFRMGRDSTCFSFAYVELYATSFGLGSCWAGFLELCLQNRYEPIMNLLNISDKKQATGAIMVGYPKYKYLRLPDRNALTVDWD